MSTLNKQALNQDLNDSMKVNNVHNTDNNAKVDSNSQSVENGNVGKNPVNTNPYRGQAGKKPT